MYTVKTFEEALETMQDSAREQFGEDFNVANTSNWYRLIGLPVSLLCIEKSQNISVTAGASTPQDIIDSVIDKLKTF